MKNYWYISDDKVQVLSANLPNWWERINIKLKFGIEGASVESEIASLPDEKLVKAINRIESRLYDNDLVAKIAHLHSEHPTTFFEYEGPTARLVQDGQYWLATVSGDTAVLLVGSASHIIGGKPPEEHVISPSANPVRAVEVLYDSLNENMDADRLDEVYGVSGELSYTWAMILRNSTRTISFSSLPRTRGIAVYAGIQGVQRHQIRRSGYAGNVSRVLVGSPIFVEQVSAAAL